jgi:hypothetical protein
MRSPFVKGMLVGILGVYVYHRFIGVPTGVKGSVPGGSIG